MSVTTGVGADTASELQRLIEQRELQTALEVAEAALQSGARIDARVRFLHGVVLMDLARDADAMRVFAGLAQDYPQLPEPYNNIATLHARAGQWDMARSALESALRNDPSHALARENLGDVYLQLAVLSWRSAADAGQAGAVLQRKLRAAQELLSAVTGGAR